MSPLPGTSVSDSISTIDTGEILEPLAPARTWIFQANPNLYDIDGAITKLSELVWRVATHKRLIAPGDKVFFWKSGREAGVVAEATVLTPPAILEGSEEERGFTLHAEKDDGRRIHVRLRIDTVVTPPLPRAVIKADPRLADLSILKFSQGTNFAVTPEQAAVLRELLDTYQGEEDEVPSGGALLKPESGSQIWAYSPGPKAQFWEEFYRDEIMAIGWDELGDLRQYTNLDMVAKKLIGVYGLQGYPINDSHACYDFVSLIRTGDRVIAKRGRDEIVGYGIVTGDYEYRPERANYRNVRRVRWERRGNWKSKPFFAVKTLTDWTAYPDTVQYITDLIGVTESPALASPLPALPPYTITDALKGTAFDSAKFADILDTWLVKKNLILQGPPGVGKTFLARRLAYGLIGHELPSRVGIVQFHQSYSYEDFIQGYRPSGEGFTRKDGVFVRFCKRASLDQDSIYVFIIDEINRCNLSKVFGELLMLIEADKRGSKYSLALTYATSEEEQFYVPSNVYILGMMNTADRSLALVDYALRRRFSFVPLEPLFGSPIFADFLTNLGADPKLVAVISPRLSALNEAISDDQNLGSGFVIGHSYFCGDGSALTEKAYLNSIRHEIIPLLQEYWFDDPQRVKQWAEKLQADFDVT